MKKKHTLEADLQSRAMREIGRRWDLCRIWPNPRGMYNTIGSGQGKVKAGGPPGCADILGLIVGPGTYLAIETKATHPLSCDCKTCPQQRKFGKMVRENGGLYMVLRERGAGSLPPGSSIIYVFSIAECIRIVESWQTRWRDTGSTTEGTEAAI